MTAPAIGPATAPVSTPATAPTTAPAGVGTADVDVVIVSYRTRDLVTAAVGSVLADALHAHAAVTVTVVDNDSRDGTVELLAADHPDVLVLPQGTNTGFARACNRGLRDGSARYVLLLNPDAVVVPGALATLVAFADAHPAAAVVAPALFEADGRPQHTARAFPTPAAAVFGRRSPLTRLFPRNRWSAAFLTGREHVGDAPFRTDWVSGAAMLLRREAVVRVGGLDEGFFLYWEDADLCRRLAAAGHEVWCVPAAHVVHDEGGSRGHVWSPRTVRCFHRGAFRYWSKHHTRGWWDPRRLAAAVLLGARGSALALRWSIHRPTPTRPEDTP